MMRRGLLTAISMIALAVGIAALDAPAAQASAQRCGKVMGVYKVKAKRTSCKKAKQVTKTYLRGKSPRGWECRWTKPGHTRCAEGHRGGVVLITESYGGGDRLATRRSEFEDGKIDLRIRHLKRHQFRLAFRSHVNSFIHDTNIYFGFHGRDASGADWKRMKRANSNGFVLSVRMTLGRGSHYFLVKGANRGNVVRHCWRVRAAGRKATGREITCPSDAPRSAP